MNVMVSSRAPMLMEKKWERLAGTDKWAAMTDEWIALHSEFNPWWAPSEGLSG